MTMQAWPGQVLHRPDHDCLLAGAQAACGDLESASSLLL